MRNPEPTPILIVDDLPDKLLVYRSLLEEPGVEVTTAASGPDALRHVLKQDFAVVLLDVNMPGMDGFETARLIRGRKRNAHTPIIFITADTDELHALRGYGYGAVDYIFSPVVPEILRTKVRVFVRLFQLNQQVREQADRRVAMAEREQAHLAALLERATDFLARVNTDAELLIVNGAGRRMLGYSPTDDLPARLADLQPPWAADRVCTEGLPAAAREGVWFGDSAFLNRDGEEVPVSQVVLAHYSPEGDTDHFSIVARDMSARARAEAELARYRAHLEELVRERTTALEQSHERLRLADRLAAVGTLTAGLGHDMGNLLLPVRMRIDALERMTLPEQARQDIRAIAEACEYLKRLSQGLRLFSLNPEQPNASGPHTDLPAWWGEVGSFMRHVLPRGVGLDASVPDGLPPVAIAPHVLTQAVYNLIQNAGDALKGRDGGSVSLTATLDATAGCAHVAVSDNGPGMTEEVMRRCVEPFFTTKSRGISTGLGLALVRGAVHGAGGRLDIMSRAGAGTTFRLVLPIASSPGHAGAARDYTPPRPACVAIGDARMRAYVASVLRSLSVSIVGDSWSRETQASLVVIDDPGERAADLVDFLAADPSRRAVVFSQADHGAAGAQICVVEPRATAATIREVLLGALGHQRATLHEVSP